MQRTPAQSAPVPPAGLGTAARALWSYWWSLPREGSVPNRCDFDPMRIAAHLPVVSINEREPSGSWRVRLAGTGIGQRASRELTGADYLDLVEPDARVGENRRLVAMLAQPCGVAGVRRGIRASLLQYWISVLALPLRDSKGGVRFLISTNEDLERRKAPEDDPLIRMGPIEGQFVDVGAGVPVVY